MKVFDNSLIKQPKNSNLTYNQNNYYSDTLL